MFLSLVYTELIKYKRTIIPWIIGMGGFLTVSTALLLVSGDNAKVNWQVFMGRGLNLMNILALLLIAVLAGYVFITEYHESTASILFTYPVSRFKLYAVKYIVILFMVVSLYLTFFALTMLFGFIYMGTFPSSHFMLKVIKSIILVIGANFVLVPVTVLFSIIIKGIGTYIFMGMSYVIAYISFINSDYSLFIPSCIPDKLATNYLIFKCISNTDLTKIAIISAVTFLTAFIIGAVCYTKSDVYKLD